MARALVELKDASSHFHCSFPPRRSFSFSLFSAKRSFGTRCDGCESISLVNVASSRVPFAVAYSVAYTTVPPFVRSGDTYEA